MNIPFHKPHITEEEIAEVVDSLRSGWLTMGPKTIRFENEFAAYIGAGHGIAVSSCTAALHLALKVIGLKAGEEVIIPTMTFTATGEVVCYFGAKPASLPLQSFLSDSRIICSIESRSNVYMDTQEEGLWLRTT